MAVSIREVASRAGVSHGTVSKVLNDSAGAQIAAGTRDRVRRAAQELGYLPNAAARALVRRQLDAIGVVLPPGEVSPLSTPFFATAFDALVRAAADRGQTTAVLPGKIWAGAGPNLAAFFNGRCDGLVLFLQSTAPPPPGAAWPDLIEALTAARFPFVLIHETVADPLVSCVDVDNRAAARTMTEHLLLLGHRRIAHLPGATAVGCVQPRIDGYREAMAAAGVIADPRLCPPGEFWNESVRARVEALVALPAAERPTALFCCNDGMAIEAIRTLGRLGLRVPHDVSVAGFDDIPDAADNEPALTTVRQPFRDLGHEAVTLLLDHVRGDEPRGQKRVLPFELVPRASTAPLSSNV